MSYYKSLTSYKSPLLEPREYRYNDFQSRGYTPVKYDVDYDYKSRTTYNNINTTSHLSNLHYDIPPSLSFSGYGNYSTTSRRSNYLDYKAGTYLHSTREDNILNNSIVPYDSRSISDTKHIVPYGNWKQYGDYDSAKPSTNYGRNAIYETKLLSNQWQDNSASINTNVHASLGTRIDDSKQTYTDNFKKDSYNGYRESGNVSRSDSFNILKFDKKDPRFNYIDTSREYDDKNLDYKPDKLSDKLSDKQPNKQNKSNVQLQKQAYNNPKDEQSVPKPENKPSKQLQEKPKGAKHPLTNESSHQKKILDPAFKNKEEIAFKNEQDRFEQNTKKEDKGNFRDEGKPTSKLADMNTSANKRSGLPVRTASYREKSPNQTASYREKSPNQTASYREKSPNQTASYREKSPNQTASYREKSPNHTVSYREKSPSSKFSDTFKGTGKNKRSGSKIPERINKNKNIEDFEVIDTEEKARMNPGENVSSVMIMKIKNPNPDMAQKRKGKWVCLNEIELENKNETYIVSPRKQNNSNYQNFKKNASQTRQFVRLISHEKVMVAQYCKTPKREKKNISTANIRMKRRDDDGFDDNYDTESVDSYGETIITPAKREEDRRIQQNFLDGIRQLAEMKYGQQPPQSGENSKTMEDYEIYLRALKANVKAAHDKLSLVLQQKRDIEAKVADAEKHFNMHQSKYDKAEEEKQNAINEGRDPELPKDFIVPRRTKIGLKELAQKALVGSRKQNLPATRKLKPSSNTHEQLEKRRKSIKASGLVKVKQTSADKKNSKQMLGNNRSNAITINMKKTRPPREEEETARRNLRKTRSRDGQRD